MRNLPRHNSLYRVFPALSHSSFRWFWGGQIISLIGTWTQNIGQAWLVLQLTNSPFLLGLVAAMQFVPTMLFSLHAGAWIDHLPKRKVLIATQTIMMILAFALAFLVGSGSLQYWMLLIMAFILGVSNTVDVPTRQSFIIELVGREHLANAIALNSAIFNAARLVGPAIAGVIMGVWGPMWCFLINGFSFIGVLGILIFVPSIPHQEKVAPKKETLGKDILNGLNYIRKTPSIFMVIIMMGFLSTVAMNFNVLVPVLAKIDLQEGALGYGLLMSTLGFGALIGALTVVIKSAEGPQPLLLLVGAFGLGIFNVVVGLQNTYLLSAFFLAFLGWSMIVFSASANSIIQITVDGEYRGRVMSVYSLVFGGMVPIGSVYAGTLSDFWGAKVTFVISGILTLLFMCGIVFLLRRYRKDEGHENSGLI
ncbi:arabinose efflux permease family protein [Desulfitobacterium dehalogenans ATCC 51507]|uniref:Arabinose efflux permease family protein n=1 Tax=Desulfitobacterium dehalogenans (strain ATCC 51507 / DSM 9161 / JW/IU-DC1) TaxID=756499 RepID=I4AA51_DESDJ|nr:MFS transporter [Desulfitobacterium dehalogenans]AFM00836.1 arabinose efflux permease family protein [Desulfitobacterium dehalogenans ATCC 51507]